MPVLSIPAAIDAVAKASLILAATALAAASLRRASASARHLVWMLGLVSALAVPAVSMVTPRWELPIVRIAAPLAVSHAAPAIRHAPPSLRTDLPPEGGSNVNAAGSLATTPVASGF